MVTGFDRIVIAVPELHAAAAQYQSLLGAPGYFNTSPSQEPIAWWGLPNTVMELVERPLQSARIAGIALQVAEATEAESTLPNALGIAIELGSGERTREFRAQHPHSCVADLLVDHLVLHTTDAAACIGLFRDQLGIRLALDKTVPEWGGRMLFFRTGKLTLEVIEQAQGKGRDEGFWGIAFQCQSLLADSERLGRRDVLLSEIREGRKPGTRVATIKSHCLQIPSLLIEPAR